MHGQDLSGFLGGYYLFIGVMNAVASLYLWRSGKSQTLCNCSGIKLSTAMLWLVVSLLFVVISGIAFGGNTTLLSFPLWVRNLFDAAMNPTRYTVGSMALFFLAYFTRRYLVKPVVAWSLFNASLLYMGLSMTDPDFALIVAKPDNVPIVGLIFLLGFFTWLGAYKAVQNDDRAREGLPPQEKDDDEKVLVWPDLVYTELICMIAVTALLIVWAVLLQAPLEEPASSVKTPNPSKAPWYFLGLQEMLVYYDPWMAGVVLPSVVVAGLMAIPFIDYNKLGNGYYTIEQRPFAYLIFQFGFIVLWVTLIIMGTFMRGPNWNFFGLYETWDAHKVEALNNLDLSEMFWVKMLGVARPKAPDGSGTLVQLGTILLRELPGIVGTVIYFALLPPMLVVFSKYFRNMFIKMGFVRYMVLANLLLLMGLLPLKMLLRWTINLKYFISIPEYFLNF